MLILSLFQDGDSLEEIQVIQNITTPENQDQRKEKKRKSSFRRNSKFMFSRSYSVA